MTKSIATNHRLLGLVANWSRASQRSRVEGRRDTHGDDLYNSDNSDIRRGSSNSSGDFTKSYARSEQAPIDCVNYQRVDKRFCPIRARVSTSMDEPAL